ncbi:MAG: hypothetical protein ACOYM8_16705 [Caulobacterales bacterium]|jgi:antitoxin ParD1/3/4
MDDAALDHDLEAFLAEHVPSGEPRQACIAALDAAIGRGLADADAGRTKPANTIFGRLEAKYREWSGAEAVGGKQV